VDEFAAYLFLVGVFCFGVFAGMLASSLFPAADDPVLTYNQSGMYDRQLAVDLPESEASVDCSVSRRDEFQVSERVFLYNSTDCSTTFGVDDGNISVNSSGVDVLFRATDLGDEFSVGYDFSDSALVCNISEADRVENSENQYPVDCGRVEEDISSLWNNGSFSDFNVHDRGRELLENQSR
jgi:hypothetical protein